MSTASRRVNGSRICVCALALVCGVLAACSPQGKRVYVYSQSEGGSTAASDAVGANISNSAAGQTNAGALSQGEAE